jgi:hypothetical protein
MEVSDQSVGRVRAWIPAKVGSIVLRDLFLDKILVLPELFTELSLLDAFG